MDYTIAAGTPSEEKRYVAGFGVHAEEETGESPTFYHGDLTRSTVMTTDVQPQPVAQVVYTAFGEPVPPASRYVDVACGANHSYAPATPCAQ